MPGSKREDSVPHKRVDSKCIGRVRERRGKAAKKSEKKLDRKRNQSHIESGTLFEIGRRSDKKKCNPPKKGGGEWRGGERVSGARSKDVLGCKSFKGALREV